MADQVANVPRRQLTDANVPIPAFPPARLDPAAGRLLPISQEELEARRIAAVRMLAAIGDIADETDTDERWEAFMRAFDESHAQRPQFEGMY